MHSNFITPPDFVDTEPLPTVTVVNATAEEVEVLVKMCENADPQFNIYLYRSEMEDTRWLKSAVERSEAVILSTINPELDYLCDSEKTYYYVDRTLIYRATRVPSPLHYFALRNKQS